MAATPKVSAENWTLLALTLAALILSGIGPHDRLTWVLEAAPVMIGIALLFATWRRFPLTPLVCRLLFAHALVLLLGAHYTYALTPPGFWLAEAFDLERNHYDRLGHLMQGFVPAILAREILLRQLAIAGSRLTPVLVVSVCLAFSAFYELIEWWGALLWGADAESFLGTQGDPWDTQWDMFLALIGAIGSLALLSRLHDRALARLRGAA